ncbi:MULTISPECIES: copper resistance protein CopC [Oceanobacillus]|uniref:Copper resistance protein CopC n=2 Tax=Oceanobacillus TaxID=182709 RepID=A0AAW5B7R5_9BACI|nr:copper resistance protein CopC [Oceanobacillus jordanicus]MCG3419715.1 copper resistance protein CopC [Oceanobacillus jordanicus]
MFKIREFYLFIVAVLLLFSIIPFSIASAHSVLEKSTPTDGQQLKKSVNSIELTFNTKIENGSTLSLVNDSGKEIQPLSVEITDNVLNATFQELLEPDTYHVNWKIIGADGHLIENQYSFTIKEVEDKKSEDNEIQTKDESIENKDLKNDEEGNGNDINQDSEKQTSTEQQTSNDSEESSVVSVIVIFLITVGILLVVWMIFGKRKK